jgi:anti-sigma regulatory factor (Ser/Thr protein kinase)
MRAGAYYYLAKPFEEEMLFTIVHAAVCERQHYKELQKHLEEHCETLGLMDSACFSFQSLDQARSLATFVANACPEPSNIVMGLSEMMINAIEHGNLGITYADKTHFNAQGTWLEEVEKRLQLEQNKNTFATVEFLRGDKEIQMIIKDQGKGFDWKPFLEMSIERATDSHGRGIAMASIVSFSRVEYQGNGNEVHVFINCL